MLKLTSNSSQFVSKTVAAALLSAAAVLSGCATGDIVTSAAPVASPALQISGTAYGGSTPISGALVSLYATGTSGYGAGAASPLIATTYTDQTTGAFTFPTSFVPADCSATQGPWVYVTVAGGDPTGASGNANGTAAAPSSSSNHAILLAAVLGNCSGLGSSTKVKINEATTVAAAYALNSFSTVAGSAGTLASLNIGAPTTNAQGLSDAVATAQLLVSPTTGNVNTSTATVLLPSAAVASLANIMSSCVNSAEYTSVGCSQILPLAKTPGSSTQPNNVFQALQNIARYPGNNVSALLTASPSQGPFQPTLSTSSTSSTTAPNDLSLGIAYPNSTLATATFNGGTAPVSLAIDASDNIWVLGANNGTTTSTYNYITELFDATTGPTYSNTLGTTATLNGTHTIRFGAFDTPSGNLIMTDKNSSGGSIIVIPAGMGAASAVEQTAFPTSLDPNDYYVALDASQNAWTASYGAAGNCTTGTSGTTCAYVEYQKAGSTYTPVTTFGSPAALVTTPTVRGVAADDVSSSAGLGTIWTANYGIFGASTGGTTVEALTPSSGTLATYTIGSAAVAPLGIATDATGNAYVSTSSSTVVDGLYFVPQGSTTGYAASSTVSTTGQAALTGIPNANSSTPAANATTPFAIGGLNNAPGYLAVDGAGNVWVANYAYGSLVEYNPTTKAYLSPYYGISPSVSIAGATLTATAVTVTTSSANIYYTGNTLLTGEQVTMSGFTGNYTFLNGNTYTISSTHSTYFTIPVTGQTAIGKTTTSGTVGLLASSQALFTCPSGTTVTCGVTGAAVGANNTIGIDRAGSVWTLGSNGTLLEVIGTAAATNPVLSAGQTGSLP